LYLPVMAVNLSARGIDVHLKSQRPLLVIV